MTETYNGHYVGERVKVIHDCSTFFGRIVEIDQSGRDGLPYRVQDERNTAIGDWWREDEISSVNDAPVTFQYREFLGTRYTAWQDFDLEAIRNAGAFIGGNGDMDYLIEIRVKPTQEFIPGYYKYVGYGADDSASLHHFNAVEDSGLDVDQFYQNYARYDVSLAE